MKQRVAYTQVVDDFDGTSEAVTVKFGFDGARYEIDLSESNRKEFEAALAPYVERARQVGAPAKKAAAKKKRSGPNSADVRAWAAENGVEVNATGRVPQAVIEQYKA